MNPWQAVYVLLVTFWQWAPACAFGVLLGGLGLWAVWMNWGRR